MSRSKLIMDKDGHLYYPNDQLAFVESHQYAVLFDTKILKSTTNADNIRKKIHNMGIRDVIVFNVKGQNNIWQARFKTETDQQLFKENYGK